MIITKEEVVEYFKRLGKYNTADVSDYAKECIKNNADVNELKKYVLEYSFIHRIYFQVSLKQMKDLKEQLDFIENNIELLQDWWHVDQLTQFLKKPCDFEEVYKRAQKYVESELPFERRWGYVVFLAGLQKQTDKFDLIISLYKDDDEYYVQMAEAWLLADLCIYNSQKTIEFIANCKLNYNILGKAIQKIQDSFRISDEVKQKCKELRIKVKNN